MLHRAFLAHLVGVFRDLDLLQEENVDLGAVIFDKPQRRPVGVGIESVTIRMSPLCGPSPG